MLLNEIAHDPILPEVKPLKDTLEQIISLLENTSQTQIIDE
jgi:hypothetical protein